jgi:hypothetical protein
MKWALLTIIAVFSIYIAYLQVQSSKTSYVNGLPLYNALPGQEFVLEQDCYAFKFKDQNSSWPLIGSRETVPDLPAEVSASNIGAELPKVRILELLHVGDHFHIASVRRDQTRALTTITFEILFEDEATRKFPRLDAYWILDHSPEKAGAPPVFLTDYAVPPRTQK